jgi:hypothetical protein
MAPAIMLEELQIQGVSGADVALAVDVSSAPVGAAGCMQIRQGAGARGAARRGGGNAGPPGAVLRTCRAQTVAATRPCGAGFKSFKQRATIRPLGPFTVIVGPNGAGKSVIGEAIAWVLGGSRKMLRAKNLASLVNNELRAAGTPTAEVMPSARPAAVHPPT